MLLCYRPYVVRRYGSDSSWVRKGLGPIRLGSEKVWVRVVPEILGPSRLGSELSDIHSIFPCSGVRPSSVHLSSVVRPSSSTISKIFFSESAGPIVLILHIHHLQERIIVFFVLIG